MVHSDSLFLSVFVVHSHLLFLSDAVVHSRSLFLSAFVVHSNPVFLSLSLVHSSFLFLSDSIVYSPTRSRLRRLDHVRMAQVRYRERLGHRADDLLMPALVQVRQKELDRIPARAHVQVRGR